MVLAHRDGYAAKLQEYKRSIEHLVEAIEQLHKETHCEDKKRDLMVLHKNAKTLMEHVSKDFKSGHARKAKK
jgi:hypothetical protein